MVAGRSVGRSKTVDGREPTAENRARAGDRDRSVPPQWKPERATRALGPAARRFHRARPRPRRREPGPAPKTENRDRLLHQNRSAPDVHREETEVSNRRKRSERRKNAKMDQGAAEKVSPSSLCFLRSRTSRAERFCCRTAFGHGHGEPSLSRRTVAATVHRDRPPRPQPDVTRGAPAGRSARAPHRSPGRRAPRAPRQGRRSTRCSGRCSSRTADR